MHHTTNGSHCRFNHAFSWCRRLNARHGRTNRLERHTRTVFVHILTLWMRIYSWQLAWALKIDFRFIFTGPATQLAVHMSLYVHRLLSTYCWLPEQSIHIIIIVTFYRLYAQLSYHWIYTYCHFLLPVPAYEKSLSSLIFLSCPSFLCLSYAHSFSLILSFALVLSLNRGSVFISPAVHCMSALLQIVLSCFVSSASLRFR